MIELIGYGILDTLYVTVLSTLLAYVIGLPLGLVLFAVSDEGLSPSRTLYRVLGGIVNFLRSVPFLILLVWVVPITRFIVGTAVGSKATIVPLVIAAFPFISRMAEGSAKEVDRGVIEASLSMGASPFEIICHVILPEARPSLINGAAIVTMTVLSYNAMAGIVGGSGLGAIAINYGYYRGRSDIMSGMIVLLVLMVWFFQTLGNYFSVKFDKRLK